MVLEGPRAARRDWMTEGENPGMKPTDRREEWTRIVGFDEGMLEKRCLNEVVSWDGVTMVAKLESLDMMDETEIY